MVAIISSLFGLLVVLGFYCCVYKRYRRMERCRNTEMVEKYKMMSEDLEVGSLRDECVL